MYIAALSFIENEANFGIEKSSNFWLHYYFSIFYEKIKLMLVPNLVYEDAPAAID
ncbi:MAG: hypothetical protein ACJA01_003245 [Saprospiraceae bacterium]|jgi:hypothetical protein